MGEGGPSVDLETKIEWTARLDDEGLLHCTVTGRDQYKRKLFKGRESCYHPMGKPLEFTWWAPRNDRGRYARVNRIFNRDVD